MALNDDVRLFYVGGNCEVLGAWYSSSSCCVGSSGLGDVFETVTRFSSYFYEEKKAAGGLIRVCVFAPI